MIISQISTNRLILMATIASSMAMAVVLYQYTQYKNTVNEWKRVYTVASQSWSWHASSMVLEHHRFVEAMGQYVNSGPESTITLQNVKDRLEIYWSRYEGLAMYTSARFSAIAQVPETSVETGFEINSILTHVNKLNESGQSTLESIEKQFDSFSPGNFDLYFEFVNKLSPLSEHVSALQFNTFNVLRDLQKIHVNLSEELNKTLDTAYRFIGGGICILLVLIVLYWHNRYRYAQRLSKTNAQLLEKISESQNLTIRLEHQATHDGLTGILNRVGFDQLLDDLVGTDAGEHGVCMVDIDRFKVVNDTAGHAAGDMLLKELAGTLQQLLPESARLARYGGDEFMLLWPDCTKSEFESTIKQCCAAIDPYKFKYSNFEFEVAGSFGALHFNASDHQFKAVLDYVDAACYEAKRIGGARVHFGGDSVHLVQARRSDLEWLAKIQSALSQNQFTLFYQPIVYASETGQEHSWEILVRMVDENNDILPPGMFLSVVERYGLSSKLDYWIVNAAFHWISQNPQICSHLACININLSGRSISDEAFLQSILRLKLAHNIEAEKVCFEITETAVVSEKAREFMLRLQGYGFLLGLDDFGSGFASFGYLEQLPVDYIKIDGLFVKDIDTNETHLAFVNAINTIGQAMNKKTVAEFVENEASIQILEEIGIDYLQGYQIGKPQALPDWNSRRTEVSKVA